ncbi:protein transport protein HofC [Xenorhabdus nematophila]|uniref:protein transport protein HofC n=2 Tax=Xenorhabdus nematophila TaxID=628 RepID=UPI00054200E2|nr:protein transport protein HofC [Xenorhabdus nematophila]CEF30839.1 component in type IV pilin biogenesis, transmembrane protein [Xenorhabdus nematophila str. Websteri]AYA40885.1 type IV pilin biogenesis protein [Xenorhabdus nematophila]MBA0019633.1 protein transport protein HofC [Xenorhabdus nematophila]MCB4423990.1 protein transport protein HofC [Xenorhabdus nematophila]QNJ35297.1 protein transport protein HofC [Xenorhabdus nematophila]
MKIEYIYQWQAINNKGRAITGESIGYSKKNIFQQLSYLDLQPYSIKCKRMIHYREKEMTYRQHFIHQLSTLLTSGIPLLRGLIILLQDCKLALWRCVLKDMIQKISQGESFSSTLAYYPKLFSPLFCQIIAVGEQTGQLENCCQLIISQLEQQNMLQKKIQKAYRYPLIVAFVTLLVILLMLIFVLPEFRQVYSSFNATLPLLTQWVLSGSDFLIHYGLFTLLIIFILLTGYLWLRKHFSIVPIKEKMLILRLPLFKQLTIYQQTTQIFHILFMTQKAGLTLTAGLECALNATHHPVFIAGVKNLHRQIQQGIPMSDALKKTPHFPSLCQQFIMVGEESGELELFLFNLAKWYQEKSINLADSLVQLLEPLLMMIMALIVGLLLLAMYLPIFQLGTILA